MPSPRIGPPLEDTAMTNPAQVLATVLNHVRACEAFAQLDDAGKGALVMTADIQALPAGSIIFRQGDVPTPVLLLLIDGEVEVSAVDHAGDSIVLGPGITLGEVAQTTNLGQRSRTVTAASDTVFLVWNLPEFSSRFPAFHAPLREGMEAVAFQRLASDLR